MARPSRKSNPGSGSSAGVSPDENRDENRDATAGAGENLSGATGEGPLRIAGKSPTSKSLTSKNQASPVQSSGSNAKQPKLAIESDDEGRGPDRRVSGRAVPSGLERRRGPGRRLSDFSRAAEEGELNREQFLFLMAIEEFKRANGKPYPSWTDVVEVVRLLGYRKTMSSMLHLPRAEDWREPPNAKAGVRPDKWTTRFSDDEMKALADGLDDLDAQNSAEAA